MKLTIYRFGVVLFISVLLPRAMPTGQHEMKRAALSSDSNNPALQPKTEGQDQTQAPEQRQDRETVIRFIRDPDPATEFAVKGIDGGTVNLAAARGKVVLLNFWATWCGPCRMEVPDLVELQKKYQDRLQVIGLAVDDADEDTVRKFAKRYAINYPVAMATDEMRACQRCQLHLSSIRKAVWCRNISACVIRSSMKWKYA
jgi:thiol-disulfide isomerase/thioredoxin